MSDLREWTDDAFETVYGVRMPAAVTHASVPPDIEDLKDDLRQALS